MDAAKTRTAPVYTETQAQEMHRRCTWCMLGLMQPSLSDKQRNYVVRLQCCAEAESEQKQHKAA